MNMTLIVGSIACMVLLLVVAGCSQNAAPVATPTPTPAPVPTTAAPTTVVATQPALDTATPGPTQTLPPNWGVDVQIKSNGLSINPLIITTFNGGKGQNVIPEIDVRVIKSDGTVEDGKMVSPFFVGETNVTLTGTADTSYTLAGASGILDRCEVWVITPQGDRIKIRDEYVPFRSYN